MKGRIFFLFLYVVVFFKLIREKEKSVMQG